MNFAVDEATAVFARAQEAIGLLQRKKLKPQEHEKAVKHLVAIFPYLNTLKYTYPEQEFPCKLYRVSGSDSLEKNDTETQIRTFSYPSPEKCDIARANTENCPVFYVADNPKAALIEADCKQGQEVYLSEWIIANPEDTTFYMFFENKLPQNHLWAKAQHQQNNQFEQILQGLPQSSKDQWKALHTTFCQAFLGEDYKVSSVIGHRLLYGKEEPHVQVLLYPSKAHNSRSSNLAIHPDFTDKYLQLKRVFKLKIVDSSLQHTPELMEIGQVKGNKISWQIALAEEIRNG